jgi:DNA-binding CsgD family transcriptional regulator
MPQDLLDAFARADWPRVKDLVGSASVGVYGRQAAQLRARLPLGVDPRLDEHRSWSALIAGNWDELERCLAANPVDPAELRGIRDIVLAPLDRDPTLTATTELQRFFLGAWHYGQGGMTGRYRRLVRAMLGWRSDPLAVERGFSPSRHARYRRLQDAVILAEQETIGGRLDVAGAIAHEAQTLGDEGDNFRVIAAEIESGVAAARGGGTDWPMATPARLAGPRGQNPVDAANHLLTLAPLFALRRDEALESMADLTKGIAVRIGAPRMLLRAETWALAAQRDTARDLRAQTAALLIKARRASVGLRALPLLLDAVATQRPERFAEAEATARRAGAFWIQVSALTWMAALDPEARTTRWLERALTVSGWRRPPLVPEQIAGDAALGLTATGIRHAGAVELARASGRPNVIYEVARRHLEDQRTPAAVSGVAIDALATLGTTHARELLHRLARRTDALGRAAAEHVTHGHPTSLSEREVEVLDLAARGLTNKEIGEQLSLSQHTIARHLANARAKLGAANRAEAAAKFGAIDRR